MTIPPINQLTQVYFPKNELLLIHTLLLSLQIKLNFFKAK